ncbi:MAG: hypothetical protein IJ690_01200 [Clostridia bacterium]|nr:hypothetical protein [Clostridia bacterium]
MEQKNLKWRDIYNNNQKRRYCEVTGIKKEDVEIESNSWKVLKDRKYIVIITTLIAACLLIWTFRNDIKVLLMVLAFFVIAGVAFFLFNYFKFVCLKDGLYIRFGLQEGKFAYDKIKSVYLSKFNDYSFLLPIKKAYSIVIRYEDSYKRIKELSFPNYFLDKEKTVQFLENFNIKELEEQRYVNFERIKIWKRIGKAALIILFILFLVGLFFTNLNK